MSTHHENLPKQYTCNIQRNFSEEKNENFNGKFLLFFNTFARNIHCGYKLEPPRQLYQVPTMYVLDRK